MTKEEAIESIEELYKKLNHNVTKLVKARLDKDTKAEWMAGQGCNIDSYQKQARTFLLEKFQNMPMFELVKYCTLGLNEEAGEVAGKVKKSIRDADEYPSYSPTI